MKKRLEEIFLVLLILMLIASILIIRDGSEVFVIQVAILVLMIVYVIIKKVSKNPIKIINNKLDIFLIVFTLSSFIPIIFQKYLSFNTSLAVSLNYVCLYFFYILSRNVIKEEYIKYVNIAIMVISVIFVLIGIENLTTDKILPFLGIENILNGENRLVSIIGNPNVLAGFLGFSFIITLHKSLYTEKIKEKIVLNICNFICFIGLILTYSKAVYILFPVIIIIYMIITRNKEKNIEIVQNIFIYIILTLIYVTIFNKLLINEYYVFIWIFLLLITTIEGLINALGIRTKKYIQTIKLKYIIIAIIAIVLCSAIWLIIELNNFVPYEVFSINNTTNYEAKKINNIKGNEKYIFVFDIYSSIAENIENMYEINIIERDNKNREIKETSFQFENYNGKKELEIITNENTREFKIEFKAKYQYVDRELVIKSLYINDKEIALQYKNLPIKLIDKIRDISLNYKTAQERFTFIKDALKLSTENWLTGIGGEGWQYRYEEVQEYEYASSDIHCYPVQILLEFGIIGFISLIGIYICVFKVKDKKYLGIKLGFLLLVLHNALDSEMKYPYIQLIVYMYFGIFSVISIEKKIKENKKAENVLGTASIIVSIVTIIVLLLNINPYKVINKLEEKKMGLNTNSYEYKEYDRKIAEQYDKLKNKEKYNLLNNSINFLLSYINSGQTEKIEEYYEIIKEYKNKAKQIPSKIILKSNGITDIIIALEKTQNPQLYGIITKFAKIQLDEYEETKKQLEETLKAKYENIDENLEYYLLQQNYTYAKESYEIYKYGVVILNKTDKDIIEGNILDDISIDNKNIIIYHTHTTEAYSSEEYVETEYKKTLNENYNILKIGDLLTEKLKSAEYNVAHIRDYNDLLGVNGAYGKSKEKALKELENNKADIVFDVHRDAGNGETIVIDDKEVAKIRFVIGNEHENWEENLSFAIKIQKKADEIYPGLFKPILILDDTYNQEISKYATLIEVGDDGNTIEEAENAIKLFAEVLKQILG